MRVCVVFACVTLLLVSAGAEQTVGAIGASRDVSATARLGGQRWRSGKVRPSAPTGTRLGKASASDGSLPPTAFGDEDKFPEDFVFGVATSAFQIEGDGGDRPRSTWDDFADAKGLGDAARQGIRHFEHVEDDLKYMARAGVKHYRFSLSWPRLQNQDGTPNEDGYQFYEKLLDALKSNHIEPYVTLHHWDLPSNLCQGKTDEEPSEEPSEEPGEEPNEESGEESGEEPGEESGEESKECGPVDWLDPKSVAQFNHYAKQVFDRLGPKIKFWTTLNEPKTVANMGYGIGMHAPGLSSATAPLAAGHNMLLAHATAVKSYREKFAQSQYGKISMNVNSDWREPLDGNNVNDVAAANRAMDEELGWFADPLFFGDYPESMKARLGTDLPSFTSEESALLKNSVDYFALNHYASSYVTDAPLDAANSYLGRPTDWKETTSGADGEPIGPTGTCSWLTEAPAGLEKVLKLVSARYGSDIDIFVTENGLCADGDGVSVDEQLNDSKRVNFVNGYLKAVLGAVQSGVHVKGYFAWSFFDNFEWADSMGQRFGIVHVDHGGEFGGEWSTRRAKKSLGAYREFMVGKHSVGGGVGGALGEEEVARLRDLKNSMDSNFYGVFEWEKESNTLPVAALGAAQGKVQGKTGKAHGNAKTSKHAKNYTAPNGDVVYDYDYDYDYETAPYENPFVGDEVEGEKQSDEAVLGGVLGRRGLVDKKGNLGASELFTEAKKMSDDRQHAVAKNRNARIALAAAIEALRQAETSMATPNSERDPESEEILAEAELVLSQAERPKTDVVLQHAERVMELAESKDLHAHESIDERTEDAEGGVLALSQGSGYSMDGPSLWKPRMKNAATSQIAFEPVWLATVVGVCFGLFLIAIQVACNLARQKGRKVCGTNEGEVKSLVPLAEKAKAKSSDAKYGGGKL